MLKQIILLMFLVLTGCAYGQAGKINHTLKSSEIAAYSTSSIIVKELNKNKLIYSNNAQKFMLPASNAKLFTALAALEYLKPNYRFVTEIRADKHKVNQKNILNGNLYIKFAGDPTLSLQDFKSLLAELKEHRIKEIKGDIIVDDQIFDQNYRQVGTSWEDSKFCFAAPVSAIILDRNCFKAHLEALEVDNVAKLSKEKSSYAKLENKIISAKSGVECNHELKAKDNNIYQLSGCLAQGKKLDLNIAYQDPRKYLEAVIRQELRGLKIKYQAIKYAAMPDGYDLIAEHQSKPLSELIRILLKDSDNLIAESLLKTIGAAYYAGQGSFANGNKAVKEIVAKKLKINSDEIKLVDGSGISRYNLVSANQIMALLEAVYQDKNLYRLFSSSLPVAGIDGTLKNRLQKYPQFKGMVMAKTGNFRDVSSLAGYISKGDKLIGFAMIFNGATEQKSSYHNLQDELLAILTKL